MCGTRASSHPAPHNSAIANHTNTQCTHSCIHSGSLMGCRRSPVLWCTRPTVWPCAHSGTQRPAVPSNSCWVLHLPHPSCQHRCCRSSSTGHHCMHVAIHCSTNQAHRVRLRGTEAHANEAPPNQRAARTVAEAKGRGYLRSSVGTRPTGPNIQLRQAPVAVALHTHSVFQRGNAVAMQRAATSAYLKKPNVNVRAPAPVRRPWQLDTLDLVVNPMLANSAASATHQKTRQLLKRQ